MGYQPVAEDLLLKDKNVSVLNIITKFANDIEQTTVTAFTSDAQNEPVEDIAELTSVTSFHLQK